MWFLFIGTAIRADIIMAFLIQISAEFKIMTMIAVFSERIYRIDIIRCPAYIAFINIISVIHAGRYKRIPESPVMS